MQLAHERSHNASLCNEHYKSLANSTPQNCGGMQPQHSTYVNKAHNGHATQQTPSRGSWTMGT
eukprot:347253-Rhodomonas_salina.1